MSESLVQELEDMGRLQEQGVSQWRAGEGEDYPMEGTLETVIFRDFMERGLTLPVSEFFYRPSHSPIHLASFDFHSLL